MSEYEDVIKLIDAEHETYVGTATIYIPRLRKALEKENKSKEEIKDRILNDCEKYWERRTIMDALGEDFKNVKKREAGKQKGKIKEEILQITNDGRTETEPPNKVSPATFADESINIRSTIPSPVESATERAKRLMQETGYDIDEDEDHQIQINDLTTRIQTLEENEKRKTIALDKAHERNKELQDDNARLIAELEKAKQSGPLDLPPQTPTPCNTEIKAKTKIQLYLSKEIITAFFKRQAVENARDIPNMTIYGEVTNYLQNDDLIIGKIGTIRSSI